MSCPARWDSIPLAGALLGVKSSSGFRFTGWPFGDGGADFLMGVGSHPWHTHLGRARRRLAPPTSPRDPMLDREFSPALEGFTRPAFAFVGMRYGNLRESDWHARPAPCAVEAVDGSRASREAIAVATAKNTCAIVALFFALGTRRHRIRTERRRHSCPARRSCPGTRCWNVVAREDPRGR